MLPRGSISPRATAEVHASVSAASTPESAGARFSHREIVVILFGLMLGMFLAALDQTIVATALPRMAADLQGVEHLSWVVSAYLLTSTAATPIYGKLSDFYGRKLMLQIAIGIFLLTSLLCGLAGTMGQLIFFRGLQGLGGGGLIAMAHATIADVISPRERGRYQAYIASAFAVASVVGPVLGGLFVDYLTWRWVFWINLPIGLGALALSERTLKRLAVKGVRHRIDYPGAVLMVAAVCCILLVTTIGGHEAPWDSLLIKGLAVAALGFFVLCVFQEWTASEPILPPRLFGNVVYAAANMANLLTAMSFLGSVVFIPLFLELVYGLPAGSAGVMLIPLTTATILAAITTGKLMAKTGRYKIFPLLGVLCTGAGMVLLSRVGAATPLPLAAAVIALCGLGVGLVNPVIMVAVQNAVQVRDVGTATASISFFRSMGGSFGVALFSAVLIARLDGLVGAMPGHEALGSDPGIDLLRAGAGAVDLAPAALQASLRLAVTHAFQDVFLLGAAIALLTLVSVLLLRELPLKTISGQAERAQQERISAAAASEPAD
jgi:EmrB/QacA subfamily drug resistance transporter